jgi:hypothetical protein
MARVIEFYVPGNFRKPWRSAPQLQSGKVIEFRSPTSRSAELTHPLSGSLAGLGIGMKPGRLVLTEEHDKPHPGRTLGFAFSTSSRRWP